MVCATTYQVLHLRSKPTGVFLYIGQISSSMGEIMPKRRRSSAAFRVSLFILYLSAINFLRRLNQYHSASSRYNHKNNKILYIVTSMREFDNGRRGTILGNNRFSKTIVPLIAESSRSMLATGYEVDFYLIALVISLFPGGPGIASTEKPIDFKFRLNTPLAQ